MKIGHERNVKDWLVSRLNPLPAICFWKELKNKNMKVLQVCHEVLCDNEPYQQLVGSKATWFCCFKGFEQSLNDFRKAVAEKYECHLCNDTGKFKGMPCIGQSHIK